MEIKIEVETKDENLVENGTLSDVPEGVQLSIEGPVVVRDLDATALIVGFLISVASGVPSNLIANWITELIFTKFGSRTSKVKITINGKGVTLEEADLENLQIKKLLADELIIQIEKTP